MAADTIRLDVDLTGQPSGLLRNRLIQSTLHAIGTTPTTVTFATDPDTGSGDVAAMVRAGLHRTGQLHGPVTVHGPTVTVTVNGDGDQP